MTRHPHFLAALVRAPASPATLVIERTGQVLAAAIEPAFTSATRNRGLLGRDGLDPGHALVIAPSNSIHTFFMRFPIDVIYADRDGRVLKIRPALRAWRLSACWGAYAVVEMAAGSAGASDLKAGDRIGVQLASGSPQVPQSRN